MFKFSNSRFLLFFFAYGVIRSTSIAPSLAPVAYTGPPNVLSPTYMYPNQRPTTSPTLVRSCDAYTASNTNSATQNFKMCNFTACPGEVLSFSMCTGVGYSAGDAFLRLFNSTNNQVAFNDDGCASGSGALFDYVFTNECQQYSLHEGCWSGNSCSGRVSITSRVPTRFPTKSPSRTPSIAAPVRSPTRIPSYVSAPTYNQLIRFCDSYSATNTDSANRNFATCMFTACPGDMMTMSMCQSGGSSTGDAYLRLFNSTNNQIAFNDDACGPSSGATIDYTFVGGCQQYSLHEGCYGSNSCNGRVALIARSSTGNFPSMSPAEYSAPSAFPSVASSQTAYFSVSDTNSASQNYFSVSLFACAGQYIKFSLCDPGAAFSDDPFMRLVNADGQEVAFSDDYCNLGSRILYAVTEGCQNYELHLGCVGDSSCHGVVVYEVVYETDSVEEDSDEKKFNFLYVLIPIVIFFCCICCCGGFLYYYFFGRAKQFTDILSPAVPAVPVPIVPAPPVSVEIEMGNSSHSRAQQVVIPTAPAVYMVGPANVVVLPPASSPQIVAVAGPIVAPSESVDLSTGEVRPPPPPPGGIRTQPFAPI